MEKEYPSKRKKRRKKGNKGISWHVEFFFLGMGVLMPFAIRLLCDGNEYFGNGRKEGLVEE